MAQPTPINAQEYLKGLEYPATKAEVIDCAEDEGADDMMLDTLRDSLPDGVFDAPTDISRALCDKQ